MTIVSNRLPVNVKKVSGGKLLFSPSDGGLATGMSSFLKKKKNKWIGWPGIPSDELTAKDKKLITTTLAKSNCYPVFLTKKQIEHYYNDYSNAILWPVLHSMPATVKNKDVFWKTYKEVNELFADAIFKIKKTENAIWVHDYHLMLLPKMVRERDKQASIGFFLHTPFPESEDFAKITKSSSLLRGLLGSDMIGFHTHKYVKNFLDTCSALNAGISTPEQIILANRTVRVSEFPIGIDYNRFADANSSREVRKEVRKLKLQHRRQKIIVTVDRMDPTKGFIERLKAYQTLLRQNPKLIGKVVMIMLAVPTREEVAAYKALKIDVEKLVKTINDKYGTARWKPIEYMYQSVPFERLSALYQAADVAFVAPKRDGMNLVAKEYVASQTKKNGVLVLSETAGAAEELRDAVLVNHSKPSSLVKGLMSALTMPKNELQARIEQMQEQIANHTINEWMHGFMDTLAQPVKPRTLTRQLTKPVQAQLIKDFRRAKNPLLLLDYDGTLVRFVNDPNAAKPSSELTTLLKKLGDGKGAEIVVVSGRTEENLERWLGNLHVSLVAEHGAAIKPVGKPWKELVKSPLEWKQIFKPALEKFAEDTPGAFVEEKNFSLVWHYRASPPYQAQKNIVILNQALAPLIGKYGLKMHNGQKIIEIKPTELNKAAGVSNLLSGSHDFVLIAGDDYTDEDMFKIAGVEAYTIRVGRGRTAANYRLKAPLDLIRLLHKLADN